MRTRHGAAIAAIHRRIEELDQEMTELRQALALLKPGPRSSAPKAVITTRTRRMLRHKIGAHVNGHASAGHTRLLNVPLYNRTIEIVRTAEKPVDKITVREALRTAGLPVTSVDSHLDRAVKHKDLSRAGKLYRAAAQ